MAEGLNRVMLLGSLGADPEFRVTSGGQQVLKMRLATSESYLDRNRQRQERTEWHNVIIWGKRAEALSSMLAKGSKLFVEGALRTSSYDDRDGNKRYKTDVIASNIILAGGGKRAGKHEEQASEAGGGGYSGADYGPQAGDDDIPF